MYLYNTNNLKIFGIVFSGPSVSFLCCETPHSFRMFYGSNIHHLEVKPVTGRESSRPESPNDDYRNAVGDAHEFHVSCISLPKKGGLCLECPTLNPVEQALLVPP